MKIADKLLNLVGVGRERGLPPPRLVAIADGLLVTERSAEAWFLISVANTDLATEAEQDAALDAAVSAAATILGDRLSHLKVVWGRSTGQDYIDSVGGHYRLGDHEAWAQTRADRIDEMRMPERYVALGVHLSDRDPRRRPRSAARSATPSVRRRGGSVRASSRTSTSGCASSLVSSARLYGGRTPRRLR